MNSNVKKEIPSGSTSRSKRTDLVTDAGRESERSRFQEVIEVAEVRRGHCRSAVDDGKVALSGELPDRLVGKLEIWPDVVVASRMEWWKEDRNLDPPRA